MHCFSSLIRKKKITIHWSEEAQTLMVVKDSKLRLHTEQTDEALRQ